MSGKYKYLILLSGLMTLNAYAQSSIQTISEKIALSAVEITYDFTYSMSELKTEGEGCVTAQGKAYRMTNSGIQMFCDGESLALMDEQAKEIIIEPVSSADFINNPTSLVLDFDEYFSVEGNRSEGNLTTYVLTPKQDVNLLAGLVTVDNSLDEPVFTSATFNFKDGTRLEVKIKSMTYSSLKPLTYFSLDISTLDSSWLITDLR